MSQSTMVITEQNLIERMIAYAELKTTAERTVRAIDNYVGSMSEQDVPEHELLISEIQASAAYEALRIRLNRVVSLGIEVDLVSLVDLPLVTKHAEPLSVVLSDGTMLEQIVEGWTAVSNRMKESFLINSTLEFEFEDKYEAPDEYEEDEEDFDEDFEEDEEDFDDGDDEDESSN